MALASPPLMDAPQGWAELPNDLVAELARRIPCEADRLRMAFVCRAWRDALAAVSVPLPPQLPWLLLPSDGSFFCLLGGGAGAHAPPLPRDARYIGSYPGGWLLLSTDQSSVYEFRNFRTGLRVPVPEVNGGEVGAWGPVIRAASISSQPNSPGFLVAALLSGHLRNRVAFWPLHSPDSWAVTQPPLGRGARVEDVLWFMGDFCVLDTDENLTVFSPTLLRMERRIFRSRVYAADEPAAARYLVETRGSLLMVVRIARPMPTDAARVTRFFRFFQILRVSTGPGKFDNIWSEVSDLDTRMLFLGRGCSRSLEASAEGYPEGMGIQAGVFFLDDRTFYEDARPPYPCTDMGMWMSSPMSHVDYPFPEKPRSLLSPAVWAHL